MGLFYAFIGTNKLNAQSINPSTGYYSLSEPADVVFNIEWGSATDIQRVVYGYWDDLNQIFVETELLNEVDYTYDVNHLTIKNSFISSLNPTPGNLQFHVVFIDNLYYTYSYWFDIVVLNSFNPQMYYSTINYDTSNPEDIINLIIFNMAQEVTSVTSNSVPLSSNDYEVQGFWIKFKQSWLEANFPTSGIDKNITVNFDYGSASFTISSIQSNFSKASLEPNYFVLNNSVQYIESIITWNDNSSVENLDVYFVDENGFNYMDYPFYSVTPINSNSALLHVDFIAKKSDKSYTDNFFALIKVNFNNNQSSYIYLEFYQTYYELSISIYPPWGGSVSGIGNYSEGEQVTIEADPYYPYTFIKFIIPGIGEVTQNPYSFNMPAEDIEISAYFLSPYPEVVSVIPENYSTNVSVNTDMTIEFNRDIQEGNQGGGFNDITFYNNSLGIYQPISNIYIENQNKLKITFLTPLNYNSQYSVFIPSYSVADANDISNTLQSNQIFYFTTGSQINPNITPYEQNFYLSNPSDITFNYDSGSTLGINDIIYYYYEGNDYYEITLIENTDYSKTSNTFTINESFISSLSPEAGDYLYFYANFQGNNVYFAINVVFTDQSYIVPEVLNYDLSNPGDLFTWLIYVNDDEFQSLTYNSNNLTQGTHYEILGDLLYIKNSFLSTTLTAPGNSLDLTVNFTSQISRTLTINSVQTGIQNATINPTSGTFYDGNFPEYFETVITWNSASSVNNLYVMIVDDGVLNSSEYPNYQVLPINAQTATLRVYFEDSGKKSADKTIETFYAMLQINFNVGAPAYYLLEIVNEYYSVNVEVYPQGAGNIWGNYTYNPGENVELYAFANSGYVFNSWKQNGIIISTDNPYIFTMPAEDLYLVAYFVPENATLYQVTANINPLGAGIVSGEGFYPQGENVTLTAIPNSGYAFTNWTDETSNVVSTSAVYSFNMPDNNIVLNANFIDISGVNSVNADNVKVYPNPFNDILKIYSGTEISKISLLDATGQIIMTTQGNTINTNSLPAGFYLLNIEFVNGNFNIQKVVKQ